MAETLSLESQVNDTASALVLLDPQDMPALASLHEMFGTLHAALLEQQSLLAPVPYKCRELVEKIILREVADLDKAIDSLGSAIVGLQAVIRDNREISQVSFPADLSPDSQDSAKQKKKNKSTSKQSETQPKRSAPETTKEAAPERNEENLRMGFEGADMSLVAEFINEAKDHCSTAEQMMMDLETGAEYQATINAIFRSFHTIKGAAGFLELRPILVVAHESETLLDLVRNDKIKIEGRVADAIFATIDSLRKLLASAEQGMQTGAVIDGGPMVKGVLTTLRSLTSLRNAPAPREVDSTTLPTGADDIVAETTNEADIDSGEKLETGETQSVARESSEQKPAKRETSGTATVKEMVKIETERLDRLVDTIGELIIAESMVGHDEEFLEMVPPRIAKNVSHLNKITRELQEMGMAMRLVPVRSTFQKLARAVRDLTRKSGKKVELVLSGEESEVDRSIIEHIGDPLMHMIRNAVDHAIESPDQRIAAGKQESGHVWLRAYHRGGNIHFEIEDDGKGLDSEKILAKAHERGLIDHTRELTEREIYNMILLPGFSTAEKVTDISGRGVGMDVVKKNIEAMRGHLEIESVRHKGTKFTMKLPLTLAMIDGMLIRVGSERYIVPTMSVIESLNLTNEKIFTIHGSREMINLRGQMLPIIRLSRLFGLQASKEGGVIVVAEDNESRVGLVADALIGQRQTVIKSLGPLFRQQKWVSGGALLSDGTVGLILDLGGLIQLAASMGDLPSFTNDNFEFNEEIDLSKETINGMNEAEHAEPALQLR